MEISFIKAREPLIWTRDISDRQIISSYQFYKATKAIRNYSNQTEKKKKKARSVKAVWKLADLFWCIWIYSTKIGLSSFFLGHKLAEKFLSESMLFSCYRNWFWRISHRTDWLTGNAEDSPIYLSITIRSEIFACCGNARINALSILVKQSTNWRF